MPGPPCFEFRAVFPCILVGLYLKKKKTFTYDVDIYPGIRPEPDVAAQCLPVTVLTGWAPRSIHRAPGPAARDGVRTYPWVGTFIYI